MEIISIDIKICINSVFLNNIIFPGLYVSLEKVLATFCRSNQFKRLYTCVETFVFTGSTKDCQNIFQKRDFESDNRPAAGLLGGYICILSRKSVPQCPAGTFGRIKLDFELEKRPAGGFWAGIILF